MLVSPFDRSGSLSRGSRRKPASMRRRGGQARQERLALDQLESRRALAITGPLSIGGNMVGSYFDAPTGVANLGDFVTVSIEGTRGTVVFNGGAGVQDGTDIQTIEILNASPDFQLTFNASVTQASPVPYSSDGVVHMGKITTASVIRGINTVRGPVVNAAAPWEVQTSAIHLYTFNDGTVSGTSVQDLVGGAAGTLVNGATVSNGQLVLAENPGPATGADVQYMSMPDGIVPDGTTAATFELWFTASNSSGTWGRGFDLGSSDQSYVLFTPVKGGGGSRAAITENSSAGERQVDGVTSFNDNTQHLATVTIDDAADMLAYYIDGIQIGTASLAGTYLSGLEAVNNFLGRSQFAFDPGFIGSMNQFAIYDKVLSPAQILSNYTAGPITSPLTPLGFTQTTPGSNTLLVEGDQSLVFPVGTFVSAAPLLPTTGAASFGTVQSVAFDSGTNTTTIVLGTTTAAGTTVGALTLAETVRPEFRLTSFVGVNFSNTNLREWGGLFVDVVEGADTVVNGQTIPNIGIVLSNGLLPYSTIGIRRELAATMILGTKAKASTDGRVFIESATPESIIYVGPRSMPVDTNSRFELIGGAGPFGASMYVAQNFIGTMNIASAATGQFTFARGVGSTATLNAAAWRSVAVTGDFAGRINSTGGGLAPAFAIGVQDGSVSMTVSRNLTGTARVNAGGQASVFVGGNVQKGSTVSAIEGIFLAVVGNSSGTVQSSFGETVVSVRGSVLNGSTIVTGGNAAVFVGRNFNGTVTSRALRFFVGGNVSQASRIVARSVEDWQNTGTPNFGIGGRLDGIVNVGAFDAAPNYQAVTLIGGGASSTARFNVDRFETDALVFNGNFVGNLRVLQDLRADLQFNGNVNRITIGGRVGSYDVDGTTGAITPVPVSIGVAGRLNFLNSNSYFQAAVPGKNGTFWNDATKTSPPTGILTTGSYGKVVPTLQQVLPPAPPTPQTYSVPGTPGGFSASQVPSAANIRVSFTAPASNGGLPVVYYQYTTDNGATWRRFPSAGQQPGTNIALNVDSSGNPFTSGGYLVSVRAVNAFGPSVATTAQLVSIPD